MATEAVLVTGATGFIGRALVARLRSENREVIALGSVDGDIAAAGTLAGYRGREFRCVVHLAGRSYVPDSWAKPAEFMRVNVGGIENVLEFCRGVQAPLVCMSAYIYGAAARQPISEDVAPQPNNPYATSKHLAEQACESCAEQHGLPVTVLRPFNVYGPGQNERFLVPTIVRQVAEGKAIEVLDLRPRRDWVFVEDVVDAVVAAAQKPGGYRVYNIGSGVSVSVEELIRRVQGLALTELPVRSKGETRQQEIADAVANISKARRELGWSPRTLLSEGLRRCIEAMDKRR